MTSKQTASSIEVAVRVRPIRGEIRESRTAWHVDATSLTEIAQPDCAFTFDRVYDIAATTAEVYERNVRGNIVARVAQGYNGTVFAYGQTGSGKSYTMFGDTANRSPGLIRLAVHDLFEALGAEQQQKPYMHTEVFVSVLEIYNEQLRDLLRGGDAGGGGANGAPSATSARGWASASSPSTTAPLSASPPVLSIRENAYGVYVHNALRMQVVSEQECISIIYAHAASRVSAATAMNEHSSRSHCVIRVSVERSHYIEDALSEADGEEDEDEDLSTQEEDDGDDGRASSTQTGLSGTSHAGRRAARCAGTTARAKAAKHKKKVISTLNMVDLAGSERVAKTGATGLRMIEGGHINKSLTTLATVIDRLASEASHPHTGGVASFIPYRDSRLTHLLKTAIGGNSFTVVLCCITPAIESADESRSTLQFASRAKRIKNKVCVNEVANAHTRMRELEAALRHTRKLLIAQTLYLWSKQLKIRKYEAQLSHIGQTNLSLSEHTPAASGPSLLMNQQQQQSMIIAQLTAQNDALREEVRDLKTRAELAGEAGGRDGGGKVLPSTGALAELVSLRQSLDSTQQLLKEREAALEATQASLNELDGLCQELEGENKAQADKIKALARCKSEAEELMCAVEEEHGALQQEVKLLRSQLQQSQTRLLEKHRGDDYLSELTALHVAHQNLQHSYSQLKEKADREKAELTQRLTRLTESNNTLEDELDEAKDRGSLINSHLWRLLSAAAQATQGKPLQIKDPAATVRDTQVMEAVRSLANVAVMANRRGSDGAGSGESVNELRSRIRFLEEQLVAKDAQRDVIVDAKLKRIQGLVLRLHRVNIALIEEMRQCFHDNELLFEIATKTSKTQKKVEKAGLTMRSLEAALSRARLAQPPHKPLYHN
ncbi:kinesin [Leishmania donovani]|uniref:Kinesin-like protein n=3 Tax=Leishmania donovani species complex TaxID=38574 RepID=A0A6L0XG66_LEIIN|nr:putative kinesin [Leishmania infantum JPCM5]TPP54106.1 Kinesin motor domain family protein [Leishmania donovani]CAC9487787.1 kinesin_-_putative [Leishmania infantum]CAJ1988753.1 kinesin [Leishmania donovani]CAM67997.1 putative kinesin [Leishmania infantum JPCM5]SUZ41750.1 kinesin_-_putative [Leishmania infantum]|eukprot:XP_001465574.1 putative kinesin [Leishmania infantum JPCM5]